MCCVMIMMQWAFSGRRFMKVDGAGGVVHEASLIQRALFNKPIPCKYWPHVVSWLCYNAAWPEDCRHVIYQVLRQYTHPH